ncbi:MAG: hypothetical protein IT169_12040 [Bryobacterales bacterium]|nr:hypothetical protein [Bryobacterales bacterium]
MRFVLLRRQILSLLGLALCGFPLHAQADPTTLVRRALVLERATGEEERHLAFQERVLSKELDGSGTVRKTTEKVHDVLMIEGSPQRILLEENGKISTPEEMAGQQSFLRKVVEIRRSESPAERKQRIDAYEKKRAQVREVLEEIPDAFHFRVLGEETRAGRACLVLEATPRAGYQPRNRVGKIFTHTHGRLWIDKESGQWVRAEGDLRETVNLGWIFIQMQKDTRAIAEKRHFPGAGWLLSELWYRTAMRVGLFITYREDVKSIYWNYREMSPGLLAEILAPGYRPQVRNPGR